MTSIPAPRLEKVTLPALVPGLVGDLGSAESVDGLELQGLDVAGRDLGGISISESLISAVALDGTLLRGASFVDSVLQRLDVPRLAAPASRWRDVQIGLSRIGSGELYNATMRSVRLTELKIGYLNLRGAELHDVLFERCTIEELDLGAAKGARVAFSETAIGTLDVTDSRITAFDLREAELHTITGLAGLSGAIMTPFQVSLAAEMLASHLGIVISD